MAWQTVATTPLGDSYGTYGDVRLQYDDSSSGTSRTARLRFDLRSGCSIGVYIDSLSLDGSSVSGRFRCTGSMDFWTGSLANGTRSFTWSCPWYSGTRYYTCSGYIPSGVVAPSSPSVSISAKTYNSATFNINISSYGVPSDTSGRYIEAAILGQNSYGNSYRYATRTNTTSASILVNNSSSTGSTALNIEGNHQYWYGGYASNTQASNSIVTGSFYTPCPPLSALSLSNQTYSSYNKVNATISYTRQSDGGAETRTGYYRYSTDGGSNYSAWTSFGTVTNSSGTFVANLPTSSSITLQAKLSTPNGGDSEFKTTTFNTSTTHIAPNFSNFEYQDNNSATVALTGNNQTMIQGQSTPLITISTANKATGNNGIAVSNYAITFIGQSTTVAYSSSSAVTATLNSPSDSGTTNLVVSAIDNLSLSKAVTKSVTIYPWSAPTVSASISRVNNFESQSTLSISGTFAPIIINNVQKNTLTVEFRTKKSSSSDWGAWTARATTISGSNWSTSNYSISLDNNYQWDVQVRATDAFTNSTVNLVLSVGMPAFFIGKDGRISIGGKPTKSLISGKHGQLEVEGQIYVPNGNGSSANSAIRIENDVSGSDTQVSVKRTDTNKEVWLGVGSGGVNHGVYSQSLNKWLLYGDSSNVYVNGINISAAALLNRFYPVGSIFLSTTHTTASSVATALGGGTWVAWGAGRVPIGVGSNGTTNYSSVESTGGSEKVTLNENHLPRISGTAYGVVTFESGAAGHFSAGRENTAYVGSGSARHWTSLTYAFGANSPTAIDHRQPYITVYMWKRTA